MEYGAANGRRTQPERALPRFLGLYGVLFLAFGVASPFLALFLATRGLSAAAIGVALSAGTAIRLVSGPAGGRVADRLRAPRAVLTACTAGAALLGWLYLPVHSSAALIGVSILHAAALAPIVPLADAMALASAAADHFAYGWVRGAGSAAFIIGTIAAGLVVATHRIASIIWLNIVLLAVSAWCAGRLPDRLKTAAPPSIAGDGVRALFGIRMYRRVMATAALIQGSHALHDGFAVINWTRAGISSTSSSLLWSLSVGAEIIVFLFLGRVLIDRLSPAGACALAALAGVFRWGILAETTSIWASALAEPLHGFTFALQHLVCVRLISSAVPAHLAGTAQAVYNTVAVGAAYAVLMLVSGWLYGNFGAHAFWAMAGLCAAAVPVAAGLRTPGH